MGYQNRQPPEGINNVETGWQKDFFLLVAGFFAGLALLAWLLMQLLGWSARWIPFGWEQAIAAPLQSELANETTPDALQALAHELADAGGLDEALSLHLHHREDDTVNAFATLGGQIVVLDGLLDNVESEQGLAFVLAHEIAHIHYRHPLQATARQLGLGLFTTLIFGHSDIATLASSGGQLAMLDYSRDMEREADAWALKALNAHYGHVAGADDLFHWLAEEQAGDTPPTWLASHPDPLARIERLRDLAAQRGYRTEGERQPLPDAW